MKRALVVGTGTLAGVAAVLALNPEPAQLAAASAVVGTVQPPTTSGPGTSGSSGSSGAGSGASTTGSATVSGSSVDVGPGYGTIQVEVAVDNGRLVDITALAVPANDPHSAMISRRVWPTLVQQALTSQSAVIAGVSGATYTSSGFAESLRAALQQAGLA